MMQFSMMRPGMMKVQYEEAWHDEDLVRLMLVLSVIYVDVLSLILCRSEQAGWNILSLKMKLWADVC